ncbi:TfoX N-terminal domain-containing protein [Reichenbachiella faecimaris]|uniref:TfoX N-terminal domain-containing protein n=1 Tax=Reichenbachiella faecimaris TaxID=692418 RepID=A0A1W2GDF4_REIFA|nr:TfoX/Sxy family protein [Reichenbachiella faecimaris]SMD34699.1 TfoX N-terminal domain-containing protein [Reichenbachiella faecimaris]
MAYDQHLADRIAQELQAQGINAEAKRLMGGLCFVLNEKMCVGTSIDKASNKPKLIARIGARAVDTALADKNCLPFQPAGRVMRDFISVLDEGIDSDEGLSHWIRLSVDFNHKLDEKKT